MSAPTTSTAPTVVDIEKLKDRVEHELLLLCSRTSLEDAHFERIEELLRTGEVHWGHLITTAAHHGVDGLLYRALRNANDDLLSQEHMAWLQGKIGARSAHSLVLLQVLGRLIGLFERESLRVIPVKGPVLALSVYGGIAVRPFVDIDLVVRPSDFVHLERVLREQGYGCRALSDFQKASYLFIHKQYTFWGRVTDMGRASVALDVHTAIMPPGYSYMEDFDALWARSRELTIGGNEARALAPEDLLMVLCYHGFKNRWDRLKYVCDVAEVLRAYPAMDWDAILRRAEAMRSRRVLELGLFLATSLLDAPLPEDVRRDVMEARWVRGLGHDIMERLPRQPFMRVEPYWDRVRLNILGQDSLMGGVRYGAYAAARRVSELYIPEKE